MRSAFFRARDSGALDDDSRPGLRRAASATGSAEELVDTGIQRLLGDLDELPHPVLGYRLARAAEPLGDAGRTGAVGQIRLQRHSPISSLVLTFGCKFACPYCPIPAYNQRQHRVKSGERIAEEMWRLNKEYGLRYFFGADDNFFNAQDTDAGHRRDAGARASSTASRWPPERPLGHRGHGSRHAPDEGAPAARLRKSGLPRAVARRRGHDRDAGQEGSERRQDHRGVSSCCATPASARCR